MNKVFLKSKKHFIVHVLHCAWHEEVVINLEVAKSFLNEDYILYADDEQGHTIPLGRCTGWSFKFRQSGKFNKREKVLVGQFFNNGNWIRNEGVRVQEPNEGITVM